MTSDGLLGTSFVKGEADMITDLIADACGAYLGASRYSTAARVPTRSCSTSRREADGRAASPGCGAGLNVRSWHTLSWARLFLLVPLASDEAAEGDQSDQRDHDSEPQAPHDRDNDPNDDEDPAEADSSDDAAAPPSINSHLRSFR